ncbi:MAG: class I SAM-dependent methyltransferase [Nitrospirales bacterium]|nr:class I SAM-dependent methyltransferase [Nitrospirales bacterium]
MSSQEILDQHRAVWQSKPVLRALYTAWYHEMVSHLQPGTTLELGGGTGNLKEFAPAVVCTDVVARPWLDVVADAQHLPIAAGTVSNIVLFDVLHHIENVRLFFDEAVRVLRPGGRIVVMDPYISWVSWPVYHYAHPEPVDFGQDPLRLRPPQADRAPFDANQAVATMLFERNYAAFHRQYPQLDKRTHRRLAFFAYPLSGGFEHPSLLPASFVQPLLALEHALGFLDRFLAFRILVVLEKTA